MSDQFIDEAGNIWRYDEQGTPVLVRQASDGPVDPTESSRVTEAENRARASELATQREASAIGQALAAANASNARAAATQAEVERSNSQLNLQLAERGYRVTDDGQVERIPGWTPRVDPGKIAQYRALESQLDRIQELYNQGPGATEGVYGALDYLPTDANQQFNTAAAGLQEIAFAANRIAGSGTQSDADLALQREANQPFASDRDVTIEEKIRQVRNRLDITKEALGLDESEDDAALGIDPNDSAMNRIRTQGGQTELEATPFGSNQAAIPSAPGINQEHKAIVDSLMAANGGRLPPFEYAQARQALDEKYLPWYKENYGDVGINFSPTKLGESVDYAVKLNEALDGGAKTINTDIPPIPYELDAVDTARNAAVNNPLGAALVGAGEGLSMGALGQVAPNYAQLAEEYPLSTLGGEMVGAGVTTAGIGGLGRAGIAAAAPKIAPRVFGGGGLSAAGRTAGADAFYGVGQGLATGVGPVTNAGLSAAGSFLGSGASAGLGKVASGLNTNPNAQYLMNQGVPVTFGRRLDGGQGIASSIEDAATSVPVIGDMVKARNLDSVEGFNMAGEPIGYNPANIGREGVTELLGDSAEGIGGGAVSRAYSDALDGQVFPLDNQFTSDIDTMRIAASQLPDDLSGRANKAIQNRIDPLMTVSTSQMQSGATPNVTGDQYQNALRGLRSYQREFGPEGFEGDYRRTLNMGINALDDLATRQSGPDVVQNLADANMAYRLSNIVKDASERAKAGGTGEVRVFSPYNLQSANQSSGNRFAGVNPMVTLADRAQRVLPSKLPDSGTAKRALGTAAVLGAAGLGESAYNEDNSFGMTQGGLGVAGVLTLLGTRRGQQLLQRAAFDRSDTAQTVGNVIAGRYGNALFGRAGAELARDLENQRINELLP